MFFPRCLFTLLALLSVTAGGPMAAAVVLCDAVDHTALEPVAVVGHCDVQARSDTTGRDDALSVAGGDCVDTAMKGTVADRLSIAAADPVPAPAAAVVVAVLPAPVEFWKSRGADRRAFLPSAHLLPLSSFVLLT